MKTKTYQKGYLLVLVLVFGAIFMTMIAAFMSFVVTQYQIQTLDYNRESALNIAEAGVDYYRWFLSLSERSVTGTACSTP